MPHTFTARLENNDSIAIVGGGPAGSFFAIRLLREARRLNRHIDVVIVEKHRPVGQDGDFMATHALTMLLSYCRLLFHNPIGDGLPSSGSNPSIEIADLCINGPTLTAHLYRPTLFPLGAL
jgi:hypothetical protein